MRQTCYIVSIIVLLSPLLARAVCIVDDRLLLAKHAPTGCPKAVDALFTRAFSCQHWAGEDGYDKARAKEIAAALKQDRCDALTPDYRTLQKRYANDAAVSGAMKKGYRANSFDF